MSLLEAERRKRWVPRRGGFVVIPKGCPIFYNYPGLYRRKKGQGNKKARKTYEVTVTRIRFEQEEEVTMGNTYRKKMRVKRVWIGWTGSGRVTFWACLDDIKPKLSDLELLSRVELT